MSAPPISTVMVTRDVESFLDRAIVSIVEQTFNEFEFVIVDFGSTDRSKSIAHHYAVRDQRIKYREIHCSNLAEARNASCQFATGKYIALMDADDIAQPNRLEKQFEFLEAHPDVGVLGSSTEWIDATERTLGVHTPPLSDAEIRARLKAGSPFWQPSVMLRKETFSLVNGYRTIFAQAEDYDLWLRMAEHSRCANLREPLLKYRIHSHQLSVRRRSEQTTCVLAAQASAAARAARKSDPLNNVERISAETLREIGVSEAIQESRIVDDCRQWIRNLHQAGESTRALEEAHELLEQQWKHVERWQIADLHLITAKIYWAQREIKRSLHAAACACWVRPKVIGRPLKQLMRRLGRMLPRLSNLA